VADKFVELLRNEIAISGKHINLRFLISSRNPNSFGFLCPGRGKSMFAKGASEPVQRLLDAESMMSAPG